ncbi:MAG TPA: type II secretion system protein [Acidimicrobiales bacterium]|nr:type II secretion system protein [Acidimicrobiales bacterium]
MSQFSPLYEHPALCDAGFDDGGPSEAGFSLIELMVVLLIIAILMAIAIPTFLGATGSANDRAAQSNLTNGITEASAAYQANSQSFNGVSAALVSSAPEFSWLAPNVAAAAGSNQISVYTVDVANSADAKGVILAAMSKSTNTCWWVTQLAATPSAAGIAGTGFDTAASGAGFQSGAATAGTFYAKEAGAGANCKANYPENAGVSFNWGTSYANAGSN